ncbi:hypothetical protein D3C73_1045470 [compost metagenome]
MHPAWHEVITCAFRGAFGQDRSFYIDEAFAVQEVAENLRRFGTEQHRLVHFRTAQVEVTVFHPQGFIHFHAVFDEERRGLSGIQHFDLGDLHFNFACRQVAVDRLFVSLNNFTRYREYIFTAYLIGSLQRFTGIVRVKYDLYDSAAVAQVNEQYAPEVTAGLYPTVKCYCLADMLQR